MKKKKLIIFSFFFLSILFTVSSIYFKSKNKMVISIEKIDVPIQSDIHINLKQTDKVINLAIFDKNDLEDKKIEQKSRILNVKEDGKVVLQVEINGSPYEATVIPYVTNGDSLFFMHLKIESKDGALFLNGEYGTRLEKSQEININLEKVVANDEES